LHKLSRGDARKFLLRKHGLIGGHVFSGKEGALAYVRQTGCVQYDPVDVCGKNAELVFQSRVKNFTKDTLSELLYEDRALVDYPDKNLSIFPTEDLPYFARYREAGRRRVEEFPEIKPFLEKALEQIEARGPLNSDELDFEGDVRWWSAIHWSAGGKASRAALEQLYTSGDLIIHHKKGTRKFYDLASRHFPKELLGAPEPLPDEFGHQKWRVLRRVGAVGLLWDRPSDAFLYIHGLDAETRKAAFKELLDEGKIIEVSVEGLNFKFYARSEDAPLIAEIADGAKYKPRCELLAPLDCFMWDRKLIKAIFGYHYMWEIYTPAEKRVYGYYTLPLVYGEDLIGRVDAAAERKNNLLNVKNIWYEDGTKQTKALTSAVKKCIERFAAFNGCEKIGGIV